MSMYGGYHIIDLKGAPLYSGAKPEIGGENHITIKKVYYNVVNSQAKRIVLSGLVLDGIAYRDYEVLVYDETIDNENGLQCILRKVWNTKDNEVTTYYLNIAEDDDIFVTYHTEFYVGEANYQNLVNEDLTFLKLDGSRAMTGNLSVGSHRITNLAQPTSTDNAATKGYADTKLALSGGTMTGNINMGSHKITNLLTPTGANEAATKQYVDSSKIWSYTSNTATGMDAESKQCAISVQGNFIYAFLVVAPSTSNRKTFTFSFPANIYNKAVTSDMNNIVFTNWIANPPGGDMISHSFYTRIEIGQASSPYSLFTVNLSGAGAEGLPTDFEYSGYLVGMIK